MKTNTPGSLFRIECEEIYLQEFSVEDADQIYQISSQPEIFNFLPDWRSTKEQRLHWLTNYEIPANHASLEAIAATSSIDGHFLKLGVFLKGTDEFIGWCCTGIKEELPPPNREIMYAISSEFQNNGYATKASKGLIDFLFTHTDIESLNAVALINNVSSNKVIRKCDFALKGQQTIDNEIYNHYILSKSDWIKNV
ncbi:GNAT family N-acetyltransferase [Planococcus sp. CAU13]|uniref:GNAT family N-acetyltransferase n=1 Tax=Planococcus sp. CAU13 TaxID=1541197 RepID=UPI00052FDFBE|nr:GNAT family N-acetyltransferase [Planococcus sp. CAU13]